MHYLASAASTGKLSQLGITPQSLAGGLESKPTPAQAFSLTTHGSLPRMAAHPG
jgi:hypothetical protein